MCVQKRLRFKTLLSLYKDFLKDFSSMTYQLFLMSFTDHIFAFSTIKTLNDGDKTII